MAVVAAPLTLRPDTLEWQKLLKALRRRESVPCLVVPWEDASAAMLTALQRSSEVLIEWLRPPIEVAEAEARLESLLRVAEILREARGRLVALEAQLVRDHKTGLFNDRHFRERLQEEFERSHRHRSSLTVILLDLDDFKEINDSTSYEFGDRVLATVAEILKRNLRSIDIAARIGGDEFAVLLPNTTLEEGVTVANRIRKEARRTTVQDGDHETTIHISQGIATFYGTRMQDPRQLFLVANDALKNAKHGGKDRVGFHDPRFRTAEPSKEQEAGNGQGQASPEPDPNSPA